MSCRANFYGIALLINFLHWLEGCTKPTAVGGCVSGLVVDY